MLYRARIVLESCSYRNCNRPINLRIWLLCVWLLLPPLSLHSWPSRALRRAGRATAAEIFGQRRRKSVARLKIRPSPKDSQ